MIVGLHPADDASRDHYLFRHLSRALLPRGVAVMRFDRRGYDVPFEDQVADTLDVIEELRSRREIDARRIGLWGFSQGAWIAPLLAARSDSVRSLVLVASVGVTPTEQMRYGTAKHLREAGHGEDAVRRLLDARTATEEWRRGRLDLTSAQAAVDAIADEPWRDLAYLPRDLATAGAWPDMDFDPERVFAQVRVPVVLFYGEDDEWMPIDASIAAWRRAAEAAGNRDVTVVRLAGARHTPTLGGRKEIDAVSPEYERVLVDWVLRVNGLAP